MNTRAARVRFPGKFRTGEGEGMRELVTKHLFIEASVGVASLSRKHTL